MGLNLQQGRDPAKHSLGHPDSYFYERDIWIDLRGKVYIDPTAELGIGVRIMTASHYPNWIITDQRKMIEKSVFIGRKSWICSYSILFDCSVGDGAVVALGSVLRGGRVDDYTMVAGNPAIPIAKYDLGTQTWVYF